MTDQGQRLNAGHERYGMSEKERDNLVRVCAECKKVMGEKAPFSDKSQTHGYCDDCIRKMEMVNDSGCICGHDYNRHAAGAGCGSCTCNEYRSIAAQELEERMVGMR